MKFPVSAASSSTTSTSRNHTVNPPKTTQRRKPTFHTVERPVVQARIVSENPRYPYPANITAVPPLYASVDEASGIVTLRYEEKDDSRVVQLLQGLSNIVSALHRRIDTLETIVQDSDDCESDGNEGDDNEGDDNEGDNDNEGDECSDNGDDDDCEGDENEDGEGDSDNEGEGEGDSENEGESNNEGETENETDDETQKGYVTLTEDSAQDASVPTSKHNSVEDGSKNSDPSTHREFGFRTSENKPEIREQREGKCDISANNACIEAESKTSCLRAEMDSICSSNVYGVQAPKHYDTSETGGISLDVTSPVAILDATNNATRIVEVNTISNSVAESTLTTTTNETLLLCLPENVTTDADKAEGTKRISDAITQNSESSDQHLLVNLLANLQVEEETEKRIQYRLSPIMTEPESTADPEISPKSATEYQKDSGTMRSAGDITKTDSVTSELDWRQSETADKVKPPSKRRRAR